MQEATGLRVCMCGCVVISSAPVSFQTEGAKEDGEKDS